METQAPTRRDLETALIEKCWKDPEFKRAVTSDPKGMLERYIGRGLPEQLKIFIHEEDANTLHFSIPPMPAAVAELSDEDLEKVAGGTEIIGTAIGLAVAVSGGLAVTAASAAAITVKEGGW